MYKEKLLYSAPEAETFDLRFEGMICHSANGTTHTEYFGDSGYEEL